MKGGRVGSTGHVDGRGRESCLLMMGRVWEVWSIDQMVE